MSAYDDSTHVTNPTAKTPEIVFKTHEYRVPAPTFFLNFDEASVAWMANKVRRGPSVCYQCTAIKKDGHPCSKAIIGHDGDDEFLCKTHRRFASSTLRAPLQKESRLAEVTTHATVSP